MTRLGVYVDDVYRVVRDGDGTERFSADRAFLLFACEVGRHFDRTVLFGRTVDSDTHADYVLPADVELAPLPYYESLGQLWTLVRRSLATARAMWRGLDHTDVVWIMGPHPFGVLLAVLALARRRRVVLGVRQDTLAYFRSRLGASPSKARLAAVRLLDRSFVMLGRFLPVTGVGLELAERYGRPERRLAMVVSLVPEAAIAEPRPEAPRKEQVRLLTVGRLDREKNPTLLIEALAQLERAEPGRFSLLWIGRGELEAEVLGRAAELGLASSVSLIGYVAFGKELLSLYREADIFVHVSLTEGVPQVIVEALASGAPVVATAVGGVPWLLQDGRGGELVPPSDGDALAAAIRRVADDPTLARELSERGVELARTLTLEAQSSAVARFIEPGS